MVGTEPPSALAPAGVGAAPGLHQRAIFSGKIIVPRCSTAQVLRAVAAASVPTPSNLPFPWPSPP